MSPAHERMWRRARELRDQAEELGEDNGVAELASYLEVLLASIYAPPLYEGPNKPGDPL